MVGGPQLINAKGAALKARGYGRLIEWGVHESSRLRISWDPTDAQCGGRKLLRGSSLYYDANECREAD